MNTRTFTAGRRLGAVLLIIAMVFATILLVPAKSHAASAPPSKITVTTSWQTFVKKDTPSDKFTKYKIVMPKDGMLTIWSAGYSTYNGENSFYGTYVKVLNADGKNILGTDSNGEWVSSAVKDYTTKVALKKGTYYIALKPIGDNTKFKVRYKAYTIPTNTTKAKARTVKKGASPLTTLDQAGKKDVYWFKVVQPTKSKLTITVNAGAMFDASGSNDKMKVAIYYGSKQVGTTQTLYPGYYGKYQITYGTTSGKANAGNYYVKVVDAHATTNGIYKVYAN